MDEKLNICLKGELDLFSTLPILLAIDSSSFVEVHPVASLKDEAQIEFLINANSDHYVDLAHTIIHARLQIKKKAADLEDADIVAPINYIM